MNVCGDRTHGQTWTIVGCGCGTMIGLSCALLSERDIKCCCNLCDYRNVKWHWTVSTWLLYKKFVAPIPKLLGLLLEFLTVSVNAHHQQLPCIASRCMIQAKLTREWLKELTEVWCQELWLAMPLCTSGDTCPKHVWCHDQRRLDFPPTMIASIKTMNKCNIFDANLLQGFLTWTLQTILIDI